MAIWFTSDPACIASELELCFFSDTIYKFVMLSFMWALAIGTGSFSPYLCAMLPLLVIHMLYCMFIRTVITIHSPFLAEHLWFD
jgi:hypothetical protein